MSGFPNLPEMPDNIEKEKRVGRLRYTIVKLLIFIIPLCVCLLVWGISKCVNLMI